MNLDELRKDTSIDAIFTYCQKYKDRIKYPDQDLLNVMYAHNVKYADWKKYNFQLHIYDNSTQSNDEIEDVVILHYTGRVKPWQLNRYTKFDRFYWKEMFLSGKQGEAVFGCRCGVPSLGAPEQVARLLGDHARRRMRRHIVTVVPRPGTDLTRSVSMKLSMIVKPMPLRSSPPVVYSGVRACATSAMPMP